MGCVASEEWHHSQAGSCADRRDRIQVRWPVPALVLKGALPPVHRHQIRPGFLLDPMSVPVVGEDGGDENMMIVVAAAKVDRVTRRLMAMAMTMVWVVIKTWGYGGGGGGNGEEETRMLMATPRCRWLWRIVILRPTSSSRTNSSVSSSDRQSRTLQ